MIESLVAVAALLFPSETSEKSVAKTPAKPAAFELYAVEKEIVQYTNRERARRGLPALTADESLVKSARRHAIWMSSRRRLQHATTASAENIAQGQSTAREAVSSWMHSAGHRANILSYRWSRIGVAAYVASNGQIYWCQQFE